MEKVLIAEDNPVLIKILKAGLAAMDIKYVSQEGYGLPMLNAIAVPAGADDTQVRKQLLEEFSIEIGGGLGALKGKAWRIGLMGSTSNEKNVMLFLSSLEKCLLDQNLTIEKGASVAAASAEASKLA